MPCYLAPTGKPWVRRSWSSGCGRRVVVLHTPWLEKSSAPCVRNGDASLGSRAGSSFPFILRETTAPVRSLKSWWDWFCPGQCKDLLFDWNWSNRYAPAIQSLQSSSIHSCLKRQTILNKPTESKPVRPLSKEKPPNWQAWSHRFQWIYGGRLCPWTLDVLTDRIILKISRYYTQLFKDEPSNKRGYIDTSNKQIVQWKKDIPNNTHCHCH